MNAAEQAMWDRWQGFLSKITERLAEILAEAEAGIREIIHAYPEDMMPVGNALQGIRSRVQELRQKVDDTWSGQVDDKFRELGGSLWDRALERSEDVMHELDEGFEAFEARMQGELYRNLLPRARAALELPVRCKQCAGELSLPGRTSAQSVVCGYCRAVNQYLPTQAIATYYQGAGHALASEAALPLRQQTARFRTRVGREVRGKSWANEPLESLERWLAMERAYWQRYAEVKAEVLGAPLDNELIESRVTMFLEQTLRRNQVWVRAKGAARA